MAQNEDAASAKKPVGRPQPSFGYSRPAPKPSAKKKKGRPSKEASE